MEIQNPIGIGFLHNDFLKIYNGEPRYQQLGKPYTVALAMH